jgi:amino-acid N-acetyltransferase
MIARRARRADIPAIAALIGQFAAAGKLLPRAESEIHAHLSRFLVLTEKRRLLACLSLENYGMDLAEIRSLAVDPSVQGSGLGTRLVEFALQEARERGIARVFAVTHAPGFFIGQGFSLISRSSIEEKVERDCRCCPKVRSCHLSAVIATVLPERAALRVIGDSAAAPLPA